MSTCPQCGAAVPVTASWCGQCWQPVTPAPSAGYAAVPAAAAAPTAMLAGVAPAVAAPPPPPAPTAAPPAAPTYAGSARFGYAPAGSPAGTPPPAALPPTAPAAPGTWQPAQPSGVPAYTAENARQDGRLLDRRALRLVAIAIGLGGVMQIVGILIGRDTRLEPSMVIGIDIVLTLAFYGVVAGVVVSQITPTIRLRWGDGSLLLRLLTGVALGAAASGLLLFVVSAAVGHLSPDPRFLLLMSEGDPTHIALVILITCIAAPLVEETLFRGLLLEALRPRGKAVAVVCSALAFAIWHFIPAALVYYGVMGAMFAAIYLKRGLATSMAAHAGFNGVLTIAAITIVLAPAHAVSIGALSFTAPGGWSTVVPATVPTDRTPPLDLRGPSGAEVAVVPLPVGSSATADQIEARLQIGAGALATLLGGPVTNVREITLPVGTAVEADIDIRGRHGDAVLLPEDGGGLEVIFLSAGSVKATEDFAHMLDSMRLG